MAKIKLEKDLHLIWAEITVEDFVQSRSTSADLPMILEKLEENYSEGRIFMLLHNDTPSSCIALIKTSDTELLQKIHTASNSLVIHGFLQIKLENSDLNSAGKTIVNNIKNILEQNLPLK